MNALQSSRGGLVVERWSDNILDSATVCSNLRLGVIYQSLSSWKAMSHNHMNAELRVPSEAYDKMERKSLQGQKYHKNHIVK